MIEAWIEESINVGASDIHIRRGMLYAHRVDGEIVILDNRLITSAIWEELVTMLCLNNEHRNDFSCRLCGVRVRINRFGSRCGEALAIRILSDRVPHLAELNLDEHISSIKGLYRGLILFAGVTGSGKTTALASLVQEIANERHAHVLTIEDPIEYVFSSEISLINQREIGTHVSSFEEATIEAMREDPDIIVLGEMRDLSTIKNAITLAETGHLVFGTIHTAHAPGAIDRIVDVFPPEQQTQIRSQTCNVLQMVVHMSLVRRISGGRYPLQEIMIVTDSIRNNLREGKTLNAIRELYKVSNGVDPISAAIRGILNFGADVGECIKALSAEDQTQVRNRFTAANIDWVEGL